MDQKKKRSSATKWTITFLVLLSVIATAVIIWAVIDLKSPLTERDLIVFEDRLTDDPLVITHGGRNPSERLRVRIEKFQGRDFLASTDFFRDGQLDRLLAELHSGDTILIGLLKTDYSALNARTSHELTQKFYLIGSKEYDYIDLGGVNHAKGSSNFNFLIGAGIFLGIALTGLMRIL